MALIVKLLTCVSHTSAFDITQVDFRSQTRGWSVVKLESRDILLQPLLPVVLGEAARDCTLNNALRKGQYRVDEISNTGRSHIEENGRSHMNAGQAVGLGDKLDVVCNLVAAVQTAIRTRLIRDLEKAVNLLLVDAYATSKL